MDNPEKQENRILQESQAGREALEVWRRVVRGMSGEQKVVKAFELTEMTRQLMRAGLRHQHPLASEEEIHELFVDRLLHYNGTSLAEVREKQQAQSESQGF